MPRTTDNLKLILPTLEEYFSVEHFNENSKAIENAIYAPDKLPSKTAVYYGVVVDAPTTESQITELESVESCNIAVNAGIYCIACRKQLRKIRDRNYLDCTVDFTESVVGNFYVYTYKHNTTVPMEFVVFFA